MVARQKVLDDHTFETKFEQSLGGFVELGDVRHLLQRIAADLFQGLFTTGMLPSGMCTGSRNARSPRCNVVEGRPARVLQTRELKPKPRAQRLPPLMASGANAFWR